MSEPRTPDNLPVSFASFLVSLGSSALVHLGEVPDPQTGSAQRDLLLARHTIDVLGLLKDKTQGNLEDDEAKLLDALLFDLRTKFLEASNGSG